MGIDTPLGSLYSLAMLGETPISSLAHKISFAVFRVSKLTRNKKLRAELESTAIDLVRDLTEERAGVLDRLIALSEAVGEMNVVNSGVLRRELNNLCGMIEADLAKSSENEAVYFGDIFESGVTRRRTGVTEKRVDKGISVGAKERHSAILEFIRQFPNDCRMKDLSGRFTHVSERTLRSDIGILIENREVERLGGKSGPASYFVAVDKSVDKNEGGMVEVASEKILLPETTKLY